MHGGKKLEVLKAQGQATITAWKATGSATIDYRMAVLGVLQMTWLRLSAYSELLRRQVAAEGGSAEVIDEDGQADTSGLVGHRYAASQHLGLYATSEEVRALVRLEAAERDAVVKYAKVAHDMGISERLTSLAERWGDVVAGRISAMLGDLELTPEQQSRVPALLALHLGSIDTDALQDAVVPNGANGSRRGIRDGGGPT